MEAYYNAVRALEDKFYGIELNHVPRRYNEEADELAKIASGQNTVPSNVFARDVAKLSINLEPTPSSQEEPSGAPRIQQARSVWMRTPQTRRLCPSCSRVTVRPRPRPWTQSQPPARRTGGQVPRLDGSRGTSLGSVRGQAHR
jgi:hypothetical protein